MPMLRVKKEWPMATSTDSPVSLEKSGCEEEVGRHA
jgi:hypothetical protein